MKLSWSRAAYGHIVKVAGWRRWFRAVVASTVVLCAQTGDWTQVQTLAPGSRVEVKQFSDRGEVRGTLQSASDETLVIEREAATVTVNRADVRRVRFRSDEKSKSGRITGAAIMGVLGIGAASISDSTANGSGWGRVGIVPIYAGIGYLIGWAVDGPKRITVYKAKRP